MSPQTRKKLWSAIVKYAAGALIGGAISGVGAYAAIGRDVSRVVAKQEAQTETTNKLAESVDAIKLKLETDVAQLEEDVLSKSELRELIRETSPWTSERREINKTLKEMNELLTRIDERVNALSAR